MSKTNLEQEWVQAISDKLVGKTIKEVRYISDEEARGMDCCHTTLRWTMGIPHARR